MGKTEEVLNILRKELLNIGVPSLHLTFSPSGVLALASSYAAF